MVEAQAVATAAKIENENRNVIWMNTINSKSYVESFILIVKVCIRVDTGILDLIDSVQFKYT